MIKLLIGERVFFVLCVQVRWDYLAATDKGYFPYHVDDLELNEDVSPPPQTCTLRLSHKKR